MDLNYTGLLNDIYSGNNITSHINTNYDYVIDNIDNTVSNCHEETENVTEIITIKNNMMHILNSIEGDTNASDTIPDKLIKLTDLYEEFRTEYLQEQCFFYGQRCMALALPRVSRTRPVETERFRRT